MNAMAFVCLRCRQPSVGYLTHGWCSSCKAYTAPSEQRRPMAVRAQNHRSVHGDEAVYRRVVAHVAFMAGWILGGVAMLVPWYQRTEPWGLLSGMCIGAATSTAYVLWRESRRRLR